jgi:general secretion pathway protein D
VITAPAKIMRSLMAVVDKLDIRRAQVLVEAIIVDVQMDKNAELGVNWAVWQNEDSDPRWARSSRRSPASTSHSSPRPSTTRPTPRASHPARQCTTFGIGRIAATGVNFAAMIRAVQGDSNTNLISTPSAVTMD